MTRYDTPGWDRSANAFAVPEPPDVADLMLWRDAQRLFGRHAGAGPDGRCVWCSCPWPCPPRRLAERAEAASRRPWLEPRSPYQGPPAAAVDRPVSPAVFPQYPVSPAVPHTPPAHAPPEYTAPAEYTAPPDYPVSPAVSPGYPVSPAVGPPAGYYAESGPEYDFDERERSYERAPEMPDPVAGYGRTPGTPVPRSGPPAGTPHRNRWADLVRLTHAVTPVPRQHR